MEIFPGPGATVTQIDPGDWLLLQFMGTGDFDAAIQSTKDNYSDWWDGAGYEYNAKFDPYNLQQGIDNRTLILKELESQGKQLKGLIENKDSYSEREFAHQLAKMSKYQYLTEGGDINGYLTPTDTPDMDFKYADQLEELRGGPVSPQLEMSVLQDFTWLPSEIDELTALGIKDMGSISIMESIQAGNKLSYQEIRDYAVRNSELSNVEILRGFEKIPDDVEDIEEWFMTNRSRKVDLGYQEYLDTIDDAISGFEAEFGEDDFKIDNVDELNLERESYISEQREELMESLNDSADQFFLDNTPEGSVISELEFENYFENPNLIKEIDTGLANISELEMQPLLGTQLAGGQEVLSMIKEAPIDPWQGMGNGELGPEGMNMMDLGIEFGSLVMGGYLLSQMGKGEIPSDYYKYTNKYIAEQAWNSQLVDIGSQIYDTYDQAEVWLQIDRKWYKGTVDFIKDITKDNLQPYFLISYESQGGAGMETNEQWIDPLAAGRIQLVSEFTPEQEDIGIMTPFYDPYENLSMLPNQISEGMYVKNKSDEWDTVKTVYQAPNPPLSYFWSLELEGGETLIVGPDEEIEAQYKILDENGKREIEDIKHETESPFDEDVEPDDAIESIVDMANEIPEIQETLEIDPKEEEETEQETTEAHETNGTLVYGDGDTVGSDKIVEMDNMFMILKDMDRWVWGDSDVRGTIHFLEHPGGARELLDINGDIVPEGDYKLFGNKEEYDKWIMGYKLSGLDPDFNKEAVEERIRLEAEKATLKAETPDIDTNEWANDKNEFNMVNAPDFTNNELEDIKDHNYTQEQLDSFLHLSIVTQEEYDWMSAKYNPKDVPVVEPTNETKEEQTSEDMPDK